MNRIVIDQPDVVGSWVLRATGSQWVPGRGTAIGVVKDGKLIAGVVFESWNGSSLMMHAAALPDQNWISKSLLWVCFAYPFKQLKANCVLAPVGSGNLRSRMLCEHLGFRLKATLEDAHPDGSLCIYQMHKHECRWLSLPQRNRRNEQARFATAA